MQDAIAKHDAFLRTKYFAALDGLRCVSITWVIGFHSSVHSQGGLLSRGYLGVDLFFVISGFLITTLLIRERAAHSQISLRNFYIRRTLRIFPLYYLVIGIYVVLVLLLERRSARGAQFFHNLPFFMTYTFNWFVDLTSADRPIFDFAWSLATEEQFYAVWPWVIRLTRTWRGPTLFAGGLLLLQQIAKSGYFGNDTLGVRILTEISSGICLGCFAAYLLHTSIGYRLAYAVAGRVWSTPFAVVLLGLTLIINGLPILLTHLAMTYLVIACCIRPDHLLSPVLTHPTIRYVGTISYGMYLLHMLGVNATKRLIPEWSMKALFPLSLIATIALASISYWLFERPILRLKERFKSSPLGRP